MTTKFDIDGASVTLAGQAFRCEDDPALAAALNRWAALEPITPSMGEPEAVLAEAVKLDWGAVIVSQVLPKGVTNDDTLHAY